MSDIEWTDETWTPFRAWGNEREALGWACEKVSEGCQHCYAETINRRLGTGLPYSVKAVEKSGGEHYLDEKALLKPLSWKKPRRIFVSSMTDIFGEWVPFEWLDRVFAVMALTPQHTYQLLTKRPERMREYVSAARPRVAALLYNATYEQRADDPLASAFGAANRRRRSNLEGRGAWRPPGPGIVRGEALRASENGVSAEAGLPPGGSDDGRGEVRHGRSSAGLDTPAWANPERTHREPQERDQGRQSTGELGACDGVGESIPRLASSQRIPSSSDWDGQSQDPSLGVRRPGDAAIALRGGHGQGDSDALRHESEGRVQNLQQGDLDSHLTWPLPNCWLGTSTENQHWADIRIPELLATPAAVRFISYEPALGPVDFDLQWKDEHWHALRGYREGYADPFGGTFTEHTARLDWVIVGGESGPGARPFDVAWARSVVAQCRAAGVAVFVKQLGAKPRNWCVAAGLDPEYDFPSNFCDRWDSGEGAHCGARCTLLKSRKGGEPDEWPEDLRVREWPV